MPDLHDLEDTIEDIEHRARQARRTLDSFSQPYDNYAYIWRITDLQYDGQLLIQLGERLNGIAHDLKLTALAASTQQSTECSVSNVQPQPEA